MVALPKGPEEHREARSHRQIDDITFPIGRNHSIIFHWCSLLLELVLGTAGCGMWPPAPLVIV
jgi:hypothetical protein